MKAWSVNGVTKLSCTTCAAEASAPSASPRFTAMRESTFPAVWIAGAAGARAASGERTGSITSYSAAMSPRASRAQGRAKEHAGRAQVIDVRALSARVLCGRESSLFA